MTTEDERQEIREARYIAREVHADYADAAAAAQDAKLARLEQVAERQVLGFRPVEDAVKAVARALGLTQPEILALELEYELVMKSPRVDQTLAPTYTKYDLSSNTLWYIWPDLTWHGTPPTWAGYRGAVKPLPSKMTGPNDSLTH